MHRIQWPIVFNIKLSEIPCEFLALFYDQFSSFRYLSRAVTLYHEYSMSTAADLYFQCKER